MMHGRLRDGHSVGSNRSGSGLRCMASPAQGLRRYPRPQLFDSTLRNDHHHDAGRWALGNSSGGSWRPREGRPDPGDARYQCRASARVGSARAGRVDQSAFADLELQRTTAEVALRTIKSPVNGVVVERFMHPGEFPKQEKILKIAQIDPLRVEVYAPVAMFGKIAVGMTAHVKPELPLTGEYAAKVTVVDRVMDARAARSACAWNSRI